MNMVGAIVPRAGDAEFDTAMGQALGALAEMGLTSVHSMDSARGFASLQRLHAKDRLPLRITYNLPLADLHHAERMGVRSGWGDDWLRFWGVKAFLDGSLGSRTAEMPRRVGHRPAHAGRPRRYDRPLRARRAQRVPPRDRRRRGSSSARRAGSTA